MNRTRPRISDELRRQQRYKREREAAAAARPPVTASCDPARMRSSTRPPTPAPPFDGKHASDAALDRYFAAMGWDRSAATFGPPRPRVDDPQLAAVEALAAARRAARAEVRRAQVEAGSRDFRNAAGADVERRARELGIVTGGFGAAADFRDPPKPQPVPEAPAPGTRARAEGELANAIAQAHQARRRVDPRKLSSAAFNVYLEGIGSGGPWDVDQGSGSAGGG